MPESPTNVTIARCSCGSVEVEAIGAPILSAACYCNDCQEGARRIEALPNAGPVRDPDGGTALVLYRKDRVRCSRGAELLKRNKLTEQSATNRVVAGCCNSAMFVDFDRGPHWVSLFRARIRGNVPALQMRVQTKSRPASAAAPSDDVPSYSSYPVKFVAKLVAARIAMLLHR